MEWKSSVGRVIGLSILLFGCAISASPDSQDADVLTQDSNATNRIYDAANADLSPSSRCGNGIIESNEACDDGNVDDGDFCSADCQSVDLCPRGVLAGDFRLPNRYGWDFSTIAKCTRVAGTLIVADATLGAMEGACNIERIEGNLHFGRFYGEAAMTRSENEIGLTSIKGLSNLKSVNGDLIIDNTRLRDLEGFENLNEVGGDLIILDNGSLDSLAGMAHLTRIGGRLVVEGNALLSGSLNGPPMLIEVGGDLIIGGNEIVGDPKEAWAAGKDVLIETHLVRINGLENLKSIGGSLYVREPELTDSASLGGLESIGGSLVIQPFSVYDLRNLTTIGKHIVMANTNATDILLELTDLSFIGGDLYIIENYQLPTCTAIDFKNRLITQGFSGSAAICGNMEDDCGSESCDSDAFDGCRSIISSIVHSEGLI